MYLFMYKNKLEAAVMYFILLYYLAPFDCSQWDWEILTRKAIDRGRIN